MGMVVVGAQFSIVKADLVRLPIPPGRMAKSLRPSPADVRTDRL